MEPCHVALIIDGNGRWAKKRLMPRSYGHKKGIENLDNIITAALQLKIPMLTFYCFSSENWNRPEEEVEYLFSQFKQFLTDKIDSLIERDIKLKVIGSKERFDSELNQIISSSEEKTKSCTSLVLNLAIDYGSRQEIGKVCQKIALDTIDGKVKVEKIDENLVKDYIENNSCPDVDLLIRTGGEIRLSNFLLFQLSYSELYFVNKFWPDFKVKDFIKAINDFSKRQRRFGGVNEN